MGTLFKNLFGLVVLLVFLAVLGRIFIFELATTSSYSMIPNLVPGDLFLVLTAGELELGEIAVCQNPKDPGIMVVGRVLGMPGTTISIENNTPTINGKTRARLTSDTMVYENNTSGEHLEYLVEVSDETVGGHKYPIAMMDRAGDKHFKKTKVEGGLFLVGDNRNRAYDSRHFGVVSEEDCLGRAIFVLWPGENSGDLKKKDRFFEWLL